MVPKFPDKQWNRQNATLFHETIPLKAINLSAIYTYAICNTVQFVTVLGKAKMSDCEEQCEIGD
jgi:hypothetical protein